MQIIPKEENEYDPLAEGTTELRENLQDSSNQQMKISNLSRGAKAYYRHPMDSRTVKMTASLQVLQDSRATKAENEVEEEFAKMAADKKAAKIFQHQSIRKLKLPSTNRLIWMCLVKDSVW